MSAQDLRQARYGTLLVTVALLGVCGGVPNSLPAQSELLDKNQKAFPVAPAAGNRRVGSSRARRSGECPCHPYSDGPFRARRYAPSVCPGRSPALVLARPAAVRDTHLAADRGRRVRGAQQRRASRRAVWCHR